MAALSPKERERIIEEEQLRFETRQTLHREHCAKHRPNRWLWWVAVAALAYFAWYHVACGGYRHCDHGMGMAGKHCSHGMMESDESGVEPGQPLPKK